MVDESRKPKICTEMLLLALMQRLKCAASRFVAVQFKSIDRTFTSKLFYHLKPK